MRTVTFQSVLWGVARLLGMRPEKDLTADRAGTLTEYINSRLVEGWRWDFWPEWTACEQRQFRPSYDETASVAAGDEVYDLGTDKYYRAVLAQAPAAEAPGNLTYWALVTAEDFDAYLPKEMVGFTPMDEVKRVLKRNPRTHVLNPGELAWEETDRGIQLRNAIVTRPWVEFRRRPPVFDSRVWSATEAVVAGMIRYVPTTGDCWLALQASTNKAPATEPTYWSRVLFPSALATWVKRAALSDGLLDLEQTDRSLAELSKAEGELQDAVDRALGAQGMWAQARVELQ